MLFQSETRVLHEHGWVRAAQNCHGWGGGYKLTHNKLTTAIR
jgi:hypothetical protein